jgi:hypothetical protein
VSIFDPDVPVACRTHDRDLWISDDAAQRAEAERRCEGCPVIVGCLAHGLAHREFGVWGGVDMGSAKAHKLREGK